MSFCFQETLFGTITNLKQFQATSNNFSRGYDIIVHRLVDHSELPSEIEFGCVLTIPGTNYEIREKSIYKIRSGRKLLTFLFLNFRTYKHLLEN